MVSEDRARRVSRRFHEVISELLITEITDPRLGGVNVSEVRVDRELAYATVFVSTLEGLESKQNVMAGLEAAKGFIRYQLSQKIQLKSFPQLRFVWDTTPEHASRINELIEQIRKDDNNRAS
ncbi:MAG: 30S ribosome-binding factor RbfA [Anaerolineales bacterium]|nr:30S ribosome-binding factor RbfA [Anaerolineales bacterium]